MPGYRLKNFAHALFSGYVVLAANVAFTLLSIPLALHYLSGPEFGLWALTAQMAGYLALVDFGLSGAVSRLLIDYKDHKERPDYGGLVKTSFLVSVAQGLIVLALGALVVPLIRPGTELTPALVHDFRWLLFGQCAWMALSFLSRNFTNLLWAHQRLDLGNYAQVVAFLVNFGVLWVSFARGAGVFSLLWGQLVGWVVGTVIQVWACGWLHLFPRAGQWGEANWKQFREVFSYGKDVFFFALGSQMINASQTILITPCLGLQAAAVWAVCTRTYTLLCQVVWRIFDSAATPLSEMYVRNEHERLFRRFRGTTVLAGSAAVWAAVMFAVCNQPFVQVWSGGKMGWAVSNDVILGVWSVLMAIQRCHVGFLGVVKDLRTVKYVYLAEGLVLVGLALLLTPKWGIAGLIASSIFATGSFSFVYGLRSTKNRFNLAWGSYLKQWLGAPVLMAVVLVPLAAILWVGVQPLPAISRFLLPAVGLGVPAAWLLWRYGLDPEFRTLISERLPFRLPGAGKVSAVNPGRGRANI